MIDYYEYSIPELVKLLGARFKDYRLRMVHRAMCRSAPSFCC